MQNRETHFEQVPLEEIRKMIEIQRKEITEQISGIEENFPEGELVETAKMIGEVKT